MQIKEQATAKAVVKKEDNLPAGINLEELAGQGQEYVTARDQKLPILKILYANSPVLDETDGKFVETARQGDIWSETSGSVWKGKQGLIVVPCLYINTFNEWKDKGDSPGRPVGIHTDPSIMSQTTRSADNKDRLPNGNYIEDTGNHFVYILDENHNPVEQALITMKSTQKKKSKTWNSMIMSRRAEGKTGLFNPPSWSTSYRLSTTKESNSQNSWYGWVVEFDKFLTAKDNLPVLETTQAFYKSAMTSDIFGKVDFSADNQSQGNNSPTTKEAVPF
jgi:hypothetical protein|tara:strand:+ start:2673 stop:3503 length:831 start_codon:yes stop_codon:yes gene_type:complete